MLTFQPSLPYLFHPFCLSEGIFKPFQPDPQAEMRKRVKELTEKCGEFGNHMRKFSVPSTLPQPHHTQIFLENESCFSVTETNRDTCQHL